MVSTLLVLVWFVRARVRVGVRFRVGMRKTSLVLV